MEDSFDKHGYLADHLIGPDGFYLKDSDPDECLNRVRALLDAQPTIFTAARLNELGAYGLTPLHLVVHYREFKCAELLLARGADVNIRSKPPKQPLPEDLTIRVNWTSLDILTHLTDSRDSMSEMYEVFEFNTLVRNFPEKKIAVGSFAAKSSNFRMDGISIVKLQEGKIDGVKVQPILRWAARPGTSDSFMDTLHNDSLGERLNWVHVPSTNGVILSKISRILSDALRPRLGDRQELLSTNFCRKPGDSAVVPGDPLLSYKAHTYKAQLVPNAEDKIGYKYSTIVFPCLMLRTVAHHKAIRERVEAMNRHFPLRPGESFTKIHLERTIDEAYYPGLSRDALTERNKTQVVRIGQPGKDDGSMPILTVAQLWFWRADNVVVSAFESELELDKQDNVGNTKLCRIGDIELEQLGSKYSSLPPDSFMGRLMAARIEAFGRPYEAGGVKFPPVLNMFEAAMLSTLSAVDGYMRSKIESRVDTEREAGFIHDISNIRGELVMIQDILDQQEEVLSKLLKDTLGPRDTPQESGFSDPRGKEWEDVREAFSTISSYRKRTQKIDRDAERIEQLIQNKLNIVRVAANIQETQDAKRLSLLVIGFTVMTVIFTPLSFVASLLAMDIDTWSSLKYTRASQPAQGSECTTDPPDDVYSGQKMAGVFIGAEALSFLVTGLIGWGLWQYLVSWLKKENAASQVDDAGPQRGNMANGTDGNVADGSGTDGSAGGGLLRRVFAGKRAANEDEEAPTAYG